MLGLLALLALFDAEALGVGDLLERLLPASMDLIAVTKQAHVLELQPN